eukprot:4356414-Pyramimonas_sp.AAC.2
MANHQEKNAPRHQKGNIEAKRRHHPKGYLAAERARLGPDITYEMGRQQRGPVGHGRQPRGGPERCDQPGHGGRGAQHMGKGGSPPQREGLEQGADFMGVRKQINQIMTDGRHQDHGARLVAA